MQQKGEQPHRKARESTLRAPALPAPCFLGGGREERAARRATTVGRGAKPPSELLGVINPADLLSVADGTEADALEALGPGAEVLGVVDPDAGRLVHHDARRVLVGLLAHPAVAGLHGRVEELIDPGVLVEARGLEGAPLAGVEHLADPVVWSGGGCADAVVEED